MSEDQTPAFQRFIKDGPGWETLRSDLLFANPYVQLRRVEVRTPARPAGVPWIVAHRKAGAVIVPMLSDGRLLLIRQERIPIRAVIWEFPAGQIDAVTGHDEADDDEAIRATALRELQEETGYELGASGELISMGIYYSSVGFTDEHSYIFLARGVTPSAAGAKHDSGESILEVRAFTPAELRQMIAGGEVRDANTMSAFARMIALGFIQ
jgi:ADP-ribose pyrophosphatase